MKKIVINKCYGGFGLSNEAAARYKDLAWIPPEASFSYYDIERDDPHLIQTIEELGEASASGPLAELKIVEIPDDVQWEIHDYDGMESIHEKHRVWS